MEINLFVRLSVNEETKVKFSQGRIQFKELGGKFFCRLKQYPIGDDLLFLFKRQFNSDIYQSLETGFKKVEIIPSNTLVFSESKDEKYSISIRESSNPEINFLLLKKIQNF